MLSRSTPEYAVRRMVSAISSAIESSVLRKSSKPIGSRIRSISQFDHDISVRVERGTRSRRDHARRVVFLDDRGAFAGRGEIGAVDDWRLAPAELGTEVDAPRSAGPAGPRAVHAERVRHARPVGDAEADHAEAHDLDGLVGSGP